MEPFFAFLYLAGLASAVLTLRALSRAETARRGYAYGAASSVMLIAVVVFGVAG